MIRSTGLQEGSGSPSQFGAGWPENDQVRLLSKLLRSSLGTRRAHALAPSLIQRFGSIPAILNAEPARLNEVPGIGLATVNLLATARELVEQVARQRICTTRPVLASWSDLVDYLHVTMAFLPVEQFRILFLDKKNHLIADEVQQTGTVDHTQAYPREIIKRSLDLSASALILVHNHPSSDFLPSSRDVQMTRDLDSVAKALGITIHDHIIVGQSGHSSLRALKLI